MPLHSLYMLVKLNLPQRVPILQSWPRARSRGTKPTYALDSHGIAFCCPRTPNPDPPKEFMERINIMITITSTVSIQFWASDLWVPRHGPICEIGGLTLPKRDW
jgi:hypothetical protein